MEVVQSNASVERAKKGELSCCRGDISVISRPFILPPCPFANVRAALLLVAWRSPTRAHLAQVTRSLGIRTGDLGKEGRDRDRGEETASRAKFCLRMQRPPFSTISPHLPPTDATATAAASASLLSCLPFPPALPPLAPFLKSVPPMLSPQEREVQISLTPRVEAASQYFALLPSI